MRTLKTITLLIIILLISSCGPTLTNAANGLSFSATSGFYEQDSLTVTVTAPKGCTVAFTTDGTMPTAEDNSGEQTAQIELSGSPEGYIIKYEEQMRLYDFSHPRFVDDPTLPSGWMLSAAVVDSSGKLGEPVSHVYFLGADISELFPDILVLSVIADPEDLLDYDRGILVAGAVYDTWRQTDAAKDIINNGRIWEAESNGTQKGKEWERPCVFQIYDGSRTPVITQAAGIRTQGGYSRRQEQKSFNLYFRDEYGSGRLKYELFSGIREYKSLTLRNGGNGFDNVKYKNELISGLVSDRAVGTLSSRPAILFLNGEFWGPYNLTDKISDRMIADKYKVSEDQVVVIKNSEVEVGEDEDLRLYEDLYKFADLDLSDPDNWKEFCSTVNINSFADYCAIRIFIGDADWDALKNDVLWRTRNKSYDDGRWNFILYDVEFSAGHYGIKKSAEETDHFSLALKNYPLLAAAIQNNEFYELFLDTIKTIGSVNFAPEKVGEALNSFDSIWQPLMDLHYKRFDSNSEQYSMGLFFVRDFFEKRYDLIIPIIEAYK